LAQKLEELEKKFDRKVASLEHELERARAVNEILNLMHRLQYLHGSNRNSEIVNLFAQGVPDVRLHFGEQGYWEGLEGIRKIGEMMLGDETSRAGRMGMHIMLQPVIEVAADGQTAQAVFWAMGILAGKDRKTGEPSATWEWNRYGDDFIKEDGQWKLWHHHVFPLFRLGYDNKWADQFKKEDMPPMQFPEDTKPYYHPPTPKDVFYSPDEELPDIPPPQPYETFDPKQAY
jgi:hypothetical protein